MDYRPLSLPLSTVTQTSFQLFTPDEVRRISVCNVTNLEALDRSKLPIKGGLYDPAMGPLDPLSCCATCGLTYNECPGHMGHIELPLPVYHPLFFNDLFRLLRITCPKCYHFKTPGFTIKAVTEKLRLLNNGDLVAACAIDVNGIDDDFDADEDIAQHAASSKFKVKSIMIYRLWRATVDEFLKAQHKKCSKCGLPSQVIKKDGYLKMMEMPVAARSAKLHDAISRKHAMKAMGDASAAELAVEADASSSSDNGELSAHHSSDSDDKSDDSSGSASDSNSDVMDVAIKSKVKLPAKANLKAIAAAAASEGSDVDAENELAEDEKGIKAAKFLHPQEAFARISRLFVNESETVKYIFGSTSFGVPNKIDLKPSADMFFIFCVPVCPTRFRPPVEFGDQILENPQNTHLGRILGECKGLQAFMQDGDGAKKVTSGKEGDKFIGQWLKLQDAVNTLIDSTKAQNKDTMEGRKARGVRQELEKKEGLMRMNMMGKRVNFACRSVISPDPNIEVDEIGIPDVFAKELTYTEAVTPYNLVRLRQAVINGPKIHPGARFVIDESGNKVDLSKQSLRSRSALAAQLLRASVGGQQRKVMRHLIDGDMVLVNRQPSLHKPSMMAHRCRVMQGQKVIRMHYANCSSYNADFDGDEMNVHLLQDEAARCEAKDIMITNNQYIVPTSSKPLRGLIQDHVCGGVLMCMLDTFLTKQQYTQLLFSAAAILITPSHPRILLLPPAIMKPVERWTGKQVISSILHNLLPLHAFGPLTVSFKSRIKESMWGQHVEESDVVISGHELMTGVLDKNAMGATECGFVHSIYEVYGAPYAGKMLSILGLVCTAFVQTYGITCGMKDLVIQDDSNRQRLEILSETPALGFHAASEFIGITGTADMHDLKLRKVVDQGLADKARDPTARLTLDRMTKQKMSKVTSGIIGACIPKGQLVPFPANFFDLMVSSGAKGSGVNFSQICCLLGQQELEGRRVPLMVTGKTLPCFSPFDSSPRAGGFIGDRFLTGLSPPEFYFHCMAGREGLVDTAVKTANSGYLQRCVVKHMESLTVNYDQTVRDSDGSIVQFFYGEDGLDTVKMSGLNWFTLLAANRDAFDKRFNYKQAEAVCDTEFAAAAARALEKRCKRSGESVKEARKSSLPLMHGKNPFKHVGLVSEKFYDAVEDYIAINKDGLLSTTSSSHNTAQLSSKHFRRLAHLKFMRSIAEPGEPVGAIAAQSIGEPSTQMTLNTFHSAGQGGNVTLGVPRLREIIMMASRMPKHPTMMLPIALDFVKKCGNDAKVAAAKLAGLLQRRMLFDFIEVFRVKESLVHGSVGAMPRRHFDVTVVLMPVNTQSMVSDHELQAALSEDFCKALSLYIKKVIEIPSPKLSHTPASFSHCQQLLRIGKQRASRGGGKAEVTAVKEKSVRVYAAREEGLDGDKSGGSSSSSSSSDDDEEMSRRGGAAKASYGMDDGMEGEMEEEDDTGGAVEAVVVAGNGGEAAGGELAMKFSFDCKQRHASLSFSVPAASKKLLMLEVLSKVSAGVVIREVPGIRSSFVIESTGEAIKVMTEGVNLSVIPAMSSMVEVNKLRSSDIWAMMQAYGVEAGRACIVEEIGNVFASYGISVNSRHLTLIADYMTFDGTFRPMNRLGMDWGTSPLLKMSFETTTKFLSEATLYGDYDSLRSPSACIAMGRPIRVGTGAFELHNPLKY